MNSEEIYKKIIDLQLQKDLIEEEIKNYKKVLDSNIVSEREPEIKIVNIPTYVSDVDEYLSNRYPTYDVISIEDRTAKIQEKESYVPKKSAMTE